MKYTATFTWISAWSFIFSVVLKLLLNRARDIGELDVAVVCKGGVDLSRSVNCLLGGCRSGLNVAIFRIFYRLPVSNGLIDQNKPSLMRHLCDKKRHFGLRNDTAVNSVNGYIFCKDHLIR
ncbi:hypothetical protein QWI17_14945 [Gilvimarinus sp. SDUM040013]|uniref:Uncharacterized protein n=1 Tax=Gilvimarinus gilvus TaxID=3058038 RepID=A0ABU4S131_9GAMM|nr:hypothetical protein [Gilvimarinus sp. SDUM040013]MDO3387142.1 hypothetical protein [Gilvimarinus sp. SDUM040013]MDX6850885.1 hypothetical protein [Gilvimarinus sp. SDUM040013]